MVRTGPAPEPPPVGIVLAIMAGLGILEDYKVMGTQSFAVFFGTGDSPWSNGSGGGGTERIA